MTNEEIISDLEAVKGFIEWEMPLNFAVTIDEVIKKLTRQKPNAKEHKTGFAYKCPSCGRRLRSANRSTGKLKDEFCPKCGQLIDWS